MKKIIIISIYLLATSLSGCIEFRPIPTPKPAQQVGLNIGVIADTQLTTPNITSGYLYREMWIDSCINVAVRTSAQEHLADKHLKIMLDALAEKSPDVILYLGDAVNSGCGKEYDKFWQVMEEFQAENDIPVFLTVGNHDYLATGNQADPDARRDACGNDSYYTKAKVVRKFSEYNLKSVSKATSLNDFRVSSFIDVITDPNSTVAAACQNPEQDQHIKGCFYSGLVELQSENSTVQLLLVDTSDYKDVDFLPALTNYLAFFGTRGSVSWEGKHSQTEWFQTQLGSSSVPRVISSHYPVTDLSYIKYKTGRPGDLMSEHGYNLWVSAHTHDGSKKPHGKTYRYGTKNEVYKTVQHLNVGSTTDYQPHSAIVNMEVDGVSITKLFSMSDEEVSLCRKALYQEFDREPSEIEYSLGLTRAYRDDGYDTYASRKNIDEFLRDHDSNKDYWVRCLMNIAAENEEGL